MANIERAIIPVAGIGSRRQPITFAVEKCMLPIGNRALVDFTVADCVKAGAKQITFVVSEYSPAIKAMYESNPAYEEALRLMGNHDELERWYELRRQAEFDFVVQKIAVPNLKYGSAVPVALAAKDLSSGQQVMVAMGDDFVFNADGSSEMQRLVEVTDRVEAYAGMLATRVAMSEVERYGVIETNGREPELWFKKIVEKPKPENATSDLINISKYVFDEKMLHIIQEIVAERRGPDHEYGIVEAFDRYVGSGQQLVVVPIQGEYMDGGSEEGARAAANRIAELSQAA